MLLKMKVIVLAFCSLFLLQACVSAPPEVYASVPLINGTTEFSGEYLPESAQSSIESRESSGYLTVGDNRMMLGKSYISAMGLNCKEVQVINQDKSSYETSVCKSDKGWFLIPTLMDKRTSEFMEG